MDIYVDINYIGIIPPRATRIKKTIKTLGLHDANVFFVSGFISRYAQVTIINHLHDACFIRHDIVIKFHAHAK